jgi:YHS domain-containing protein
MKPFRVAVAVLAAAGFAWGFQGKPINETCPVKTGTPIKPNITTAWNGKTVAFCCNNCKGLFEAAPEKYAGSLGPQPRVALNSIADALKAGKEGSKPAAILFMDGSAKSKSFGEALGDKGLDEEFAKVAYAAVLLEKGSDEAKKFSVSSAPTLVIVDPTAEGTKVLKTLTSAAPKGISSAIEDAVKKVSKK